MSVKKGDIMSNKDNGKLESRGLLWSRCLLAMPESQRYYDRSLELAEDIADEHGGLGWCDWCLCGASILLVILALAL
jgi:hypothetical protein